MQHIGVGGSAAGQAGVSTMSKQIMCSLFCPMINKFGVCESSMRKVERVRECPHNRLREVSKLNTARQSKRRCADV